MPQSAEKKQSLKIDAHAHVFLKSLSMTKNRRYTPNYNASFEEYFDLLKSNGMDGGLLIQPSFLGTDNSYLIKAIAQARVENPPLLIKGVAVVDLSISTEELTILKQNGITGIRLNCISEPLPDFSNTQTKLFFERINALNMHVEIQIEGDRLDSIFDTLLLSNSRVVIDHFGLPTGDNKLFDSNLSKFLEHNDHELCVKISAPYRVFPHLSLDESVKKCSELAINLHHTLGPNRLIWGSDWPWTQNENSHSFSDTLLWADNWISKEEFNVGQVPDWLMNPDCLHKK